jgi:nicotinamidase-related amidase
MANLLHLDLRRFTLGQDADGCAIWQAENQILDAPAAQVAIIVCDMWDDHWSRGAALRVNHMAPRMNEVLHAARNRGVHIIHAPSDTLSFYADAPARQRILQIPPIEPPAPREIDAPPLPIDDTDHGSDTGETETHRAWSRQHPALTIDETRDVISDQGREIYSYLQAHGIAQVLIMGVHTNMCVLNRSFGIKQMVKWGVPIALVRDLTDTMYNPARSPYVDHAEGTRLVIGYIERYWCPSLHSRDLLSAGNN